VAYTFEPRKKNPLLPGFQYFPYVIFQIRALRGRRARLGSNRVTGPFGAAATQAR
jgi:hypothetical protein